MPLSEEFGAEEEESFAEVCQILVVVQPPVVRAQDSLCGRGGLAASKPITGSGAALWGDLPSNQPPSTHLPPVPVPEE